MSTKSIIIISGMVDATIKEYQPDVEFFMFRSLEALESYLDKNPIRANLLFMTQDVVGGKNTTFSYLRSICENNDFLSADRIIYITDESGDDLPSFNYIVEQGDLTNWEVIQGPMQRSFITEVINGTYRNDNFDANRKVVVRRPRADYVKEQLRNHESLSESYVSDDKDLQDIPDEILPELESTTPSKLLQRMYIAGLPSRERTAFALITAQYLACQNKVLIVESDPDYHLLTEFATKADVEAAVFTITDLYNDLAGTIEAIKEVDSNLVIVECIDRISFSYKFVTSLLYYNLAESFDYMVQEVVFEDVPYNTYLTVVVPSTVTGILETCEKIDKSNIPYCSFVGIDLLDLPETHVSSGIVMSRILSDITSSNDIKCPVLTLSSLRLGSTAYDLGKVLGRSVS